MENLGQEVHTGFCKKGLDTLSILIIIFQSISEYADTGSLGAAITINGNPIATPPHLAVLQYLLVTPPLRDRVNANHVGVTAQ